MRDVQQQRASANARFRNVRLLLLGLALGGCSTMPDLGLSSDGPKWVTLFNGKNFDGWNLGYAAKPQDSRPSSVMFEIKGGVIHTYPHEVDGTTQPNAYIQTKNDYGDYVVHVEYRWGIKKFKPRYGQVRDAGLVFHNYENPVNNWPHGVECQIEEGDTGDTWTISSQVQTTVTTDPDQPSNAPPGAQPIVVYTSPEKGGQLATIGKYMDFIRIRHSIMNEVEGWNTVEVIARGDTATYVVNGVVNMRLTGLKKWDAATASWVRLDRGKILLQAEDSEVYYRNIRIRPLTDADK